MMAQNLDAMLSEHAALDIEGIDRMYLNVCQPMLQSGGGVCRFFRERHDRPVASTVLMAPLTRKFVHDIRAFIDREGIDRVRFRNGERKDDETQQRLKQWQMGQGRAAIEKPVQEVQLTPC